MILVAPLAEMLRFSRVKCAATSSGSKWLHRGAAVLHRRHDSVELLQRSAFRIFAQDPQFVISRHEQNLREASHERIQAGGKFGQPVSDVARQDQNVVSIVQTRHLLDPFRVDVVVNVYVRQGEYPGCHGGLESSRQCHGGCVA